MMLQLSFGEVFAVRVALAPRDTGLVTDTITSPLAAETVWVGVIVGPPVGVEAGVALPLARLMVYPFRSAVMMTVPFLSVP